MKYIQCRLNTPKTRFSESRFSKIHDLMNNNPGPFFITYSLSRLNLVNKRGLTSAFTKSSLGCTYNYQPGTG